MAKKTTKPEAKPDLKKPEAEVKPKTKAKAYELWIWEKVQHESQAKLHGTYPTLPETETVRDDFVKNNFYTKIVAK